MPWFYLVLQEVTLREHAKQWRTHRARQIRGTDAASSGRVAGSLLSNLGLCVADRLHCVASKRGPSSPRQKLWQARAALLFFIATCCACAGSQRTPPLHVPLFTRAGQGEAGLIFRPASPRSEVGGTIRLAATDELRLGGSVAGATRRRSDGFGDDETRYPTFFADGFLGAEWRGLIFRFGGLVGSGYGASEVTTARCAALPERSVCPRTERLAARTRYVRSYGQLHVGLVPPGIFAAAFAVRVPWVVELADEPSREGNVSPEIAFTHSILLRHLRFDLQPIWSRAQGFTLHLALLLRFRPARR